MDEFLARPPEERHRAYLEASVRRGLTAAAIEKDVWICWILRELFSLPEIGVQLTFKGGTSLSKGWKLIERFSEDLDVTVSRSYLGFGAGNDPASAGSGQKRARRVEELRERCRRWVGDELELRFRERLSERLSAVEEWRFGLDPEDPSGLTLLFEYSAIESVGDRARAYVRPAVKIEMGALSDPEPYAEPTIEPYLAEALPGILAVHGFTIRTVLPVRTFWEKAMLLHEERFRAGGAEPKPRLARHYYDLWCLGRRGIAAEAIRDVALFDRIAAHRAIYFRKNRLARESLRRGSLGILPRDEHRSLWAEDYRAMQESMIFGETPSFEEILSAIRRIEEEVNRDVREGLGRDQ